MEKLFNTTSYTNRRNILKHKVGQGIVLLPGNNKASINYQANVYPFRQDSNFLYYFGLDSAGLAGIIDTDTGDEIIFGPEFSVDDFIWDGHPDTLKDRASMVGVATTMPLHKLGAYIANALQQKRTVHFLPPYRGDRTLWLAELLGIQASEIGQHVSVGLIAAIVSMRTVKDNDEIQEIEHTLNTVTSHIYYNTLKLLKPGVKEYELMAMAESVALHSNLRMAYPVICTINGHFLHNESYHNTLHEGNLLLLDAGCESPMHYATDITRTYPVSKKFSQQQAAIYQLVLDMMQASYKAMKPGISYASVHNQAALTLAEGLKALGLMQGNMSEAVQQGAHALFFPHGLGHLIGLDVHDMEDMGEPFTGYDEAHIRSSQFGTRFLRYGKQLLAGATLTVEPGIYFVPALIEVWKHEKRFEQYINYPALDAYMHFGGIRIEENVVVTDTSVRILGNTIPKELAAIENLRAM